MIRRTNIYVAIIFISIVFLCCEAKNKEINKSKTEADRTVVEKNEIRINELSNSKINAIFTIQIREKLKLQNCIKKVFEYNDKSGANYLITTQSDCANANSKAIQFVFLTKDELKVVRRVKDFVLPEGNAISCEYNIFIWHKYLTIEDLDKDGFVDFIFVYGTTGENGFEDNRVKQIIIYKGSKTTIRHQNAVLDDDRVTQIDESFYNLPISLRKCICQKMNQMVKDGLSIYNSKVLNKVNVE